MAQMGISGSVGRKFVERDKIYDVAGKWLARIRDGNRSHPEIRAFSLDDGVGAGHENGVCDYFRLVAQVRFAVVLIHHFLRQSAPGGMSDNWPYSTNRFGSRVSGESSMNALASKIDIPERDAQSEKRVRIDHRCMRLKVVGSRKAENFDEHNRMPGQR